MSSRPPISWTSTSSLYSVQSLCSLQLPSIDDDFALLRAFCGWTDCIHCTVCQHAPVRLGWAILAITSHPTRPRANLKAIGAGADPNPSAVTRPGPCRSARTEEAWAIGANGRGVLSTVYLFNSDIYAPLNECGLHVRTCGKVCIMVHWVHSTGQRHGVSRAGHVGTRAATWR